MGNRKSFAGVIVTALLLGVACDKPAATPPPAETRPAAAPAPTTQEILNGPRKEIALDPLPFTVRAPANWATSRHGQNAAKLINMLDGVLPNGDVHVLLSERETISAERLKVTCAYVQKEKSTLQKTGGDVSVRDQDDIRIVERLQVPEPRKTDPIDELVAWRIDLYVPSGVNFESYELNVIGLPTSLWRENRTLLEEILHSVKYQPLVAPK